MTYTEEEAETKWCPQARVAKNGNAGNRYQLDIDAAYSHAFAKCIGSNCMMWRWAQKPNPDWKPESGHSLSWPQRDMRHEPPMYIDDTARGYCGLAGRPQ